MKKLIVFDVGGVFRDSSKALNEAYKRGFDFFGIEYKFNREDTWHLRGLGKYNNSENCIKLLLALTYSNQNLKELIDDEKAEEIMDGLIMKYSGTELDKKAEKITEIYKKFFSSEEAEPLIQMFPNSKNILKELAMKYELSIFSNSNIKTIKRDFEAIGVENFSAILSEEDVTNKKPSGEGIIKTMKILNADPENTYYVGDAVSDILAARDAKCNAVVVLSGMGTKKQLERAKPDIIIKDLSKLIEALP